MNPEKQKALNEAYKKFMDLIMGDLPLDSINDLAVDDVTGYGSTVDEKINDINRLRQLVIDQREQGAGIEISIYARPVHRRISPKEDTSIFIDEIEVTIQTDEEKNFMTLRLSTIFELIEDRWKVVHMHGSTGVKTEGDTWHLDEWKKKMEELQKLVDEKTVELQIKNRELEIEASLERVRARTMAMHKSEELADAASVLFQELKKLRIESLRSGVGIIDYEKDSAEMWLVTEADGKAERKVLGHVNASMHPLYKNWFDTGRKKKPYFTLEMKGDELKNYYETVSRHWQVPVPAEFNHNEVYYGFFFPEGTINVITLKRLSEDQCNIVLRFAKVFGLTYRRFLDLQKAEAQAKESGIQLALERVRARTMAMHYSDELGEVASVLFEQIGSLTSTPDRFNIAIANEENKSLNVWITDQEGHKVTQRFIAKTSSSPVVAELFQGWKKQKDHLILDLYGEKLEKWIRYMGGELGMPFKKDSVKDHRFISIVYFSHGFIGITTHKEPDSETIHLLERFSKVFQQTYVRFLDLLKAEAQAREAQIESALERVRTKAMSMQKSEDLSDAVKIVFDELDKLNLGMIRCGIGILNRENRTADVYTTTISEGKNTIQISGDESMDIHPLLRGAFDAWLNRTDFSYVLEGDDLTDYYKSLLGVNFKLPESQSKLLRSEGLKQYYYVSSFHAGGLFAFRETPFPDESKIVMKRFADVFNLTYTRFNDLLQAEAQNKIIQADNERKTKELEEARELQLAMLPKEIPNHPGLDIKVFMQTATEVGGDYYDFSNHIDGSFNIAIGDATGHGMKAGTLVTMMKSLFVANSAGKDIEGFFTSSNAAIKNSNLKRMMVGFAMLNISDHKARYINAGMPSIYHYIKNEKKIKEIKQHNLPLGAMKIEKYNAAEINLNKGDVLLLMTDGFPELHNPAGELFGYERVYSTFEKAADKEPEDIIKHFNEEGKRWREGKELLDDVTFVVVKVK